MNLLTEIRRWLLQQDQQEPFKLAPIHGGSICDAYRLDCANGKRYFVKRKDNAPSHFFKAEAASLKAIADTNTLKTPTVYCCSNAFLLLEYLPATQQSENYWQVFAHQLAAMHQHTSHRFGFTMDNFCGGTPQPNSICTNGYDFFIQHRLMYQGRLARDQQLLTSKNIKALEHLCDRLTQIIPEQPAVLVHGDLWSGNHLTGLQGETVLIDPACYWGWAETDIAMTKLFGGFPPHFYQEYLQYNSLQPGWEDRMDLYNLYHLLNHLNLFGPSYFNKTVSVIKRYQ